MYSEKALKPLRERAKWYFYMLGLTMKDLEHPDWSGGMGGFEWVNYVDEEIQALWDNLLPHERLIVFLVAACAAQKYREYMES